MNSLKKLLVTILLSLLLIPTQSRAVDLVLAGGVALREWENLRGPEAHDKWWANFIRASTMHMGNIRQKNPHTRIVWIVYKPAYIARSAEDSKPYVNWIEDNAKRYGAELIWVSTTDHMYAAINNAPRGRDKITSFYYFGHSNAYAFMLDYSCEIIGVSKVWMHQTDLRTRIRPGIFAPDADCRSFGCYTGESMSGEWYRSLGVRLWGNLKATRYQPLSDGRMPEGTGRWVY